MLRKRVLAALTASLFLAGTGAAGARLVGANSQQPVAIGLTASVVAPPTLQVTTTTTALPPATTTTTPPPPTTVPKPKPVPVTTQVVMVQTAPPAPVPDPGSNQALGQQLAAEAGWTGAQWDCLNDLWGNLESGWQVHNSNHNSGAYGIPQALPGSKMASKGADWHDSPRTQILWGLDYIAGRYGTPCQAHSARLEKGWY